MEKETKLEIPNIDCNPLGPNCLGLDSAGWSCRESLSGASRYHGNPTVSLMAGCDRAMQFSQDEIVFDLR